MNPDFCWSYYNLADVLVKLEKWEEAVNAYRRTIELNPDFCWSYYNLADVLVKLEQKEEAITAYQKAIKLAPDWEEAKQYLADTENPFLQKIANGQEEQEAREKLTTAEQLREILAIQRKSDLEKVAGRDTIKVDLNLADNDLLNTQEQYHFKTPDMQEIDEQEFESLKSEVNVLIMTATHPEISSVLELLEPYPGREKILKYFSEAETYYVGKFGAFNTVVTKCRMGSIGPGAAGFSTLDALRKVNPKATIMVGIAFGKDEKKQNIGDVLVASEIICYESKRIGEKEDIYRDGPSPSNTTLLNRFENVHHWEFNGVDNLPCKIIHGAILSGEKLVDNYDFKAQLFEDFPKAIGGEMEGAGLSSACMREGKPWILVKSICDWADGKKHSKYQPLAARAAASLIHHVLQQKTVLNGID
ncbi:hypothetical protein CYANOKiyG1_64630 [Okeania sp. KiyG1]|nr:hypothetical protein CYANOKiyG1_64630 [Okeania sp. KiyG1]